MKLNLVGFGIFLTRGKSNVDLIQNVGEEEENITSSREKTNAFDNDLDDENGENCLDDVSVALARRLNRRFCA